MSVMVVTGASSGIGLELARKFTSKGWTVFGLARSRAKLEAVANELGSRFRHATVDVSDRDQVRAVFREIEATTGPIDVLINNAAVFRLAGFMEHSWDEIDTIIDTNLKGTIYCTKAVLEGMLSRGHGRIINISSVAGTHGLPGQAPYCSSKYGVNGFAEALNQELIEKGVSIATVCPGGVNTPLWDPKTNPYPPGDVEDALDANEIAAFVEFMLSRPAKVIFKQNILFPSNEWH